MFKKWFGKKEGRPQVETIYAPVDGKTTAIEDVPDPTFSQKMMGDGIAVTPSSGNVVAPVAGEIVQLFHTKHAVGIRSRGGIEILIHIGLETVGLNGEGFTAHVRQGDRVKVGDPLITFDLEFVKEKAASTITPVVITNGEKVEELTKNEKADVQAGQSEMMQIRLA